MIKKHLYSLSPLDIGFQALRMCMTLARNWPAEYDLDFGSLIDSSNRGGWVALTTYYCSVGILSISSYQGKVQKSLSGPSVVSLIAFCSLICT
jgi:hypothetical protein